MQLKPIEQQVVVVFGASSGIGRETALRFAARGAKLVLAARSVEGLRSLLGEIRDNGGEAIAVAADVTDFDQVRAVAGRAVDKFGRLDTWVHLAAVSLYAPFEQTTPEEWRRIIDVNLNGQAYGAMAALPYLRREGRGALIHISSVEAKRGMPLHSAYSASKHGIDGFLEALRLELRHEGVPISVTNVMPGTINTPLFNKSRTKIGVKPKGLPPIYQPSIVAKAILYAAEHPIRDIIVGGAGWAMIQTQRTSPRLMDALLERTAFRLQRTDEPKSEDAPDNLFKPISGYDTVEGDFTNQAMPKSIYTWLERHPPARRAIMGAALGTITLLAARAFSNADGAQPSSASG